MRMLGEGRVCRSLPWLASLAFTLAPLVCTAATSTAPLTIEAKIPLGEVVGRIDHLAFDPRRARLYVAELGNNSIGIVDLRARQVIRTVRGFDEPQGVGYEPASDTVYVANGGDGSVRLFTGSDFKAITSLALGDDADNVRVDQSRGRVYVGYGEGALAVIDPGSRKQIARIPLAGHPESFQPDESGHAIFVNVPKAGQVAVVSRDSDEPIATWPTGKLRANFPMALDSGTQRVIAVFREPAFLQAFDAASGRKVAGTDTCGDSDDVFVDAKRRRLYVVCGDGSVDVLDASGEQYAHMGRLATSAGSRTGLFLPELDRLVVAIRARQEQPAAVWVLRPSS